MQGLPSGDACLLDRHTPTYLEVNSPTLYVYRQNWFADDSSSARRLLRIRVVFEVTRGHTIVRLLRGAKQKLVGRKGRPVKQCKNDLLRSECRDYPWGLILGGVIGDLKEAQEFVADKVILWVQAIERLSLAAKKLRFRSQRIPLFTLTAKRVDLRTACY